MQAEDVAAQADAVVPAKQIVHAPHGVEPAEIVINACNSTLRKVAQSRRFG